MPILDLHRALVARVDAFEQGVRARREADMRCREGCSACCHAELTVSDVEAALLEATLAALDVTARAALADRLARPRRKGGPCVLLDDDGRCVAYEGRPLVCRTQGLPLRYSDGVVPVEAVLARARGSGDPLTWCPLNFEGSPPAPEDVLDAERVDTMLALSNRAHVEAFGGDPTQRTSLRTLAEAAAARR